MIIAHSCTQCGHADYHRTDRHGRRTEQCPNPCGCVCTPGEPTLRPTFDERAQLIERIIPPGGKGERGHLVACACPECKKLYDLLNQTVTAGAS